eukprot:3473017-Amphidinium_carterae.1
MKRDKLGRPSMNWRWVITMMGRCLCEEQLMSILGGHQGNGNIRVSLTQLISMPIHIGQHAV